MGGTWISDDVLF